MVRLAAVFLIAAFALAPGLRAQDSRTLDAVSGTVAIDGTSNKQDWSVSVDTFTGVFEVMGAGESLSVGAASFTVPGRSIKGEGGVIMNRLMHNTLKVQQHPEIKYEMTEVSGREVVDGVVRLQTLGTLEIAGVSREVAMTVEAVDEGGVRFRGSQEIDMTEWRMKPPTALFGSLHVAKTVTVRFDVVAAEGGEAESGG